MSMGFPQFLTIWLFIATVSMIVIWPAGRICKRLGLSPLLGILAIVPIVNVILLWFVAMSDWPARPAH